MKGGRFWEQNSHWILVTSTLCALKLTDDLFLIPQFGSRDSLLWQDGLLFFVPGNYNFSVESTRKRGHRFNIGNLNNRK